MNRFPVSAGVLAAFLAAFTPSASAEPDLSGKSETYVSAYRSAYVACLEKSAGEVAKCEAEAASIAAATEARLSLVTPPTDPVAASTPTGQVSPGALPAPLPTEGIEKIQRDFGNYRGVDAVIRVPVKITNFRALRGKTIEESNPVTVRCMVGIKGGGSFSLPPEPLPDLHEGQNYQVFITLDVYQGLYKDQWPEGAEIEYAHCSLWADTVYAGYCKDQNWDEEASFCRVYRKEDGTYEQLLR